LSGISLSVPRMIWAGAVFQVPQFSAEEDLKCLPTTAAACQPSQWKSFN